MFIYPLSMKVVKVGQSDERRAGIWIVKMIVPFTYARCEAKPSTVVTAWALSNAWTVKISLILMLSIRIFLELDNPIDYLEW